jgi:hypothetical protein
VLRVHLKPRRAALPQLPRSVIDDREYTMRRVLSDFPDPLLAALISGLELHGGRLRSGTLFASYSDSCACGAMIRQLHPDQFECGRWTFLVRHRWRKRAASYGGTLQTDMHVAWMETIFDRAVYLTLKRRNDVSERTAARAVGQWMLAEAEQELGRRYDRVEAGLPAIDSWRDLPLRRWGEGLQQRFAGVAGAPLPV